MTYKQLSPAAQAVSNAAKSSLDWSAGYLPNAAAAAALRAAVAHTQRYRECDADELLAIANELEGK
jgi:hypothetical protein